MKTYTENELAEILAKHKKWLGGKEGGERAVLRSADLRYADLSSAVLRYAVLRYADLRSAVLRSADLRYADLSYADLRYAVLSGIKISWSSHSLLSELLWHKADTIQRQMLAAFVGRKNEWCWDEFSKMRHKEKKWAIDILKEYAKDDKTAPDILKG